MISGVINVYKEKNFTSFDVVAKLRGILKQKKIGHTGTLDPDATGVLVVCLGKGTKLCDMLTSKNKEYEVTMLLGVDTDTEDIGGKVLERNIVDVTENQVIEAINSFVGEYMQVPPMYSAIKVNGKKLYELAREGKVIERTPRPITINSILITDIKIPYVTFTVDCSKGTYIRSLCRDIGNSLGCKACMAELKRNRVNDFFVEDSLTLEQIEELRDKQELDKYIIPIDKMFMEYKAVHVKEEFNKLIYNGNKFYKENLTKAHQNDNFGKMVRVYDEKENFIGIYFYNNEKNEFSVYKMFLE